MRDRKRPGVVRDGGQVRRRLEAAEEVGLLEDDARRVGGGLAELVEVGHAPVVGDLDDLEAEAGRVGLHDLAHLRVHGLAEDDLRAPGRVLRDEARVCGHGGAVVPGGVRDVHAGELADGRLVFEDRLQDALAHLGLIRGVRGQELAAREDGVDDCGHVVVVDPGAEEGQLPPRVHVALGQLRQVGDDLRLRERGVDRQLAVEANAFRDVAEQLLDRGDADGGEHRLAVGVGK